MDAKAPPPPRQQLGGTARPHGGQGLFQGGSVVGVGPCDGARTLRGAQRLPWVGRLRRAPRWIVRFRGAEWRAACQTQAFPGEIRIAAGWRDFVLDTPSGGMERSYIRADGNPKTKLKDWCTKRVKNILLVCADVPSQGPLPVAAASTRACTARSPSGFCDTLRHAQKDILRDWTREAESTSQRVQLHAQPGFCRQVDAPLEWRGAHGRRERCSSTWQARGAVALWAACRPVIHGGMRFVSGSLFRDRSGDARGCGICVRGPHGHQSCFAHGLHRRGCHASCERTQR